MIDSTVSLHGPAETGSRPGESAVGDARPWLILTHHLPPEPAYLRVKVRRRLARIGAQPLKSSVYALPCTADTLEDFQWLRLEIEREGGTATLCEAAFIDGVTDARLRESFNAARDDDYADLVDSAAALTAELEAAGPDDVTGIEAGLGKIQRRLERTATIDFFGAPRGMDARQAAERLERALHGEPAGSPPPSEIGRGRRWVTRVGVKEDRMASAWLIRRFIDPDAVFTFVHPDRHTHREDELRFDMFDGEFTHVGDACTFETLIGHFRLRDPALTAIGEIVHDIDFKDDKFARAEVEGVAAAVRGIVRREAADAARLERGFELFEDLYAHFGSVE